jgi:hypothetical protein
VDIECRAINGWTPLMTAARHGYLPIVEMLLEYGANVNAREIDGWSPLMIAAENGHPEVVRVLIENGADVKTQGKEAILDPDTPSEAEVVVRKLYRRPEKRRVDVRKLNKRPIRQDVNAPDKNRLFPPSLAAWAKEDKRPQSLQEKLATTRTPQEDFTKRFDETDVDEAVAGPSNQRESSIIISASPDRYDTHHFFTLLVKELISDQARELGHSDVLRQIKEVASEILYSRPKSIEILKAPDNSWISRLGYFIHDGPQNEWDLWHFSAPRILPPGYVQLTWECVSSPSTSPTNGTLITLSIKICHDTRKAMVPESFGKRLIEINQTLALSSTSTATSSTTAFTSPPSSLTLPSSQKKPQDQSTGKVYLLSSQALALERQSSTMAATVPTVIPMPITSRYVLFMVNSDRLLLRAIESQSLSNDQFFRRLRFEYRQLRGWFRTWLGLSIFSHCDFQKVNF